MLSKNHIKLINSLKIKKFRDTNKKFRIEGDKVVLDFLKSDWPVTHVFARKEWLAGIPRSLIQKAGDITEIETSELKKISSLQTPHNVLAIVEIQVFSIDWKEVSMRLSLFLDGIQDPGNFGTIIRIAAWFGITDIFCSPSCVDMYNPKVVQASMGALLKVKIHYVNPEEFFPLFSETGLKVYGTQPEGDDIYQYNLGKSGLIIMGNESIGISGICLSCITDRLYIPDFNPAGTGIDSLNVAVATAIVCSEFKRRKL